MNESGSKETRFTEFLEQLAEREQRAALAALRRGLGKEPGEAAEMFPYLAPWTQNLSGWAEETYYLVASLFALHPESWHGGGEVSTNLGASLAQAASPEDQAGIERRFVALLNSHRDDLPDHLRHAISLCKAKSVPIDWLTLLRELRWWNSGRHSVQRDWAKAFWRHPDPPSGVSSDSAS